jgi:hypothetical protein
VIFRSRSPNCVKVRLVVFHYLLLSNTNVSQIISHKNILQELSFKDRNDFLPRFIFINTSFIVDSIRIKQPI